MEKSKPQIAYEGSVASMLKKYQKQARNKTGFLMTRINTLLIKYAVEHDALNIYKDIEESKCINN